MLVGSLGVYGLKNANKGLCFLRCCLKTEVKMSVLVCFILFKLSGLVGTTSQTTRWTVLVLDFRYILSVYLNRQYAYVKTMRFCANMFLKGLFTSDIDYMPGISASEARKLGLLDQGVSPLPREMTFPLPKGADWHELYDYIKFPPDSKIAQFGIMANAKSTLARPKVDVANVYSQEDSSPYQEKRTKLNHISHVDVRGKPPQETLGSIHTRGEGKVWVTLWTLSNVSMRIVNLVKSDYSAIEILEPFNLASSVPCSFQIAIYLILPFPAPL